MSPEIEIQEQYGNEMAEMTALPEAMKDYFAAKGEHIFLGYVGPMYAAQNSARRCHVVQFDELPAEIQQIARDSFDRPESHFGTLRRADTLLFSQPIAARDHFRNVTIQKQIAQEDASDARAEDLNEIVRQRIGDKYGDKAAMSGFARVEKKSTARVRDQAVGGRQILAEIQKAGR